MDTNDPMFDQDRWQYFDLKKEAAQNQVIA
jgi:hypothetical protein